MTPTDSEQLNPVSKAPLAVGRMYKPKEPASAIVTANYNLTPESEEDWHHIVFKLEVDDLAYVEGQSLGVIAPGEDDRGKPHKVRLYSIASAGSGEGHVEHTAALSVKRLVYDDPDTGQQVSGVCSGYLCDLKVGDRVTVTGPAGKAFVIPSDPSVDLILFATGTGVAPFRAFLERMADPKLGFSAQAFLFYGVRRRPDLAYMNEVNSDIERLAAGENIHLDLALSRENTNPDGSRVYVQHRLLARGDDVRAILDRQNFAVYICGLKGMEQGIDDGFRSLVGDGWEEMKARLKKEGRWNQEVY